MFIFRKQEYMFCKQKAMLFRICLNRTFSKTYNDINLHKNNKIWMQAS